MFEHLDDPSNGPRGTEPQLAAARLKGRELIRHRRRTALATGTLAVAATAGIAAVATVGLPGGRAGATPGGSAGPTPSAAPTAQATPTAAPTPSTGPTPTAAPTPNSGATPTAAPTASSGARPTAAPTPSGGPTPTAVPTPSGANPPSPVPRFTGATAFTKACQQEGDRLQSSTEPAGYARWNPGSDPSNPGYGVIGWTHPAGPLTTLRVDVQCKPFDPADVPAADGPVNMVHVLKTHHWVVGDPANGHMTEVWTADNGSVVKVEATFAPTADRATIVDAMGRFSQSLIV